MNNSIQAGEETASVFLRISAPELDPDVLTKELGLSPDHAHRRGDLRKGDPKFAGYKQGMWSLKSRLPEEKPFEAHLDDILSALEPRQSYVQHLAEHAKIDFYCVLYNQQGFDLSPNILGRIANLRAVFGVTVHPPDSDSEVDSRVVEEK